MSSGIQQSKPKKKKILIIVGIFVIVLAAVSIVLFHQLKREENQPESTSEQQLKNDFSATMDTMLGKSDENVAYISGMTSLTDNSFMIFADSTLGDAVSKHIQYSIKDIDINDTSATLTIDMTSPDIYGFLQKSADNGHTFDTSEEAANYLITELDKGIDTIQLTADCSFEYQNEHWYWTPSKEVLNALSGNLYMYFENNGYDGNGGE